MCLYPRIVKNKRFTNTWKNGGVIPAVNDNRTLYVPVKCGKCMECMKAKAREWQIRLGEEIKNDKRGIFVTLTFSNQSIKELTKDVELTGYELDNEIAKKGVRRFLERWRKKYKRSVKHWLVPELGHNGTENVHLHGIIFTSERNEVEKLWKYGWVYLGEYVNEATVNYIVKYIHKRDEIYTEYVPRILTSAGIGKGYLNSVNARNNKFKEGETKETYTNRQGYEMMLPVYYRNHLYSEEEREKLWIEKLDKEKRYVDGAEIDISKGEDEYFARLAIAQEKNVRLGYGNNTVNWERKRYEQERRNMNYKRRKGLE